MCRGFLGDDNGYFQNVEFLETRLNPESAAMILHRGDTDLALEFGEDFVRGGGYGELEESVTAPLVFAGFGIRAPEYDHDDFADIDAEGKILVLLTGAPPRFATDERAFYSSGEGKRSLAVAQGAVGILSIRTPEDRQRLTWPHVRRAAAGAGMRWLEGDGSARDGYEQLTGSALLSDAGAQSLFDLAGRDLDASFDHHLAGGTGSFELGVSATLKRRSVQRRRQSPNVLGLLPGSDPTLRHQYVLFTAHLDHLGLQDGEGSDDIYNGAYDNAAGVATMLVVADAIASTAPGPRRSILFAALTAEEKGLRGSDFLAQHPPVPIERIVANINVDMPYLGHPIADVEGLGAEHSTLHAALARAADQLDLTLTPDPRPELVRLIRSDQFSFVKRGVPGLNLKPGSQSSDPAVDGAALRGAFLQNHYHEPSDDMTLPYDDRGATRFARLVHAFAMIVANDDATPRWKEGDFFGDRFGRRRDPD